MAFNLVKSLGDRENGGLHKTGVWFLTQKLDKLCYEEWWFDHSLVLPLVAILKILVIRHASVRTFIFTVLKEWEMDEDSTSVIFLDRRLAKNLSDLNLDYVLDMTEEILMLSN